MIVIEREAILTVLSKPPLLSNSDDELEYVLVSHPKTNHGPLVQLLRPSTSYDDEECCSLASTSYSSSTSISEDEDDTRSVSFSNNDEVHLVKRLYPKESLNDHFYSYEETQRFRQEYRLERKLLAELNVDDTNEGDELQELLPTNDLTKHRISHVVVLHNDKIETFCDPKKQSPKREDDFFDNDSFWSGSITWY